MAKDLKTQVLVIGAGPTGLMAANQLARFGIDFLAVDKKSGPTRESRAIAVTARSLEIYQQMGISELAVNGGKIIRSFSLYSAGKQKAEVKIGEIGKGLSAFSYMLAFEQSKNEELLVNNLQSASKNILWNSEFTELNEHRNTIRASIVRNGEIISIEAQYLIACDGANSAVRQQLNFSFKGGTYAHKFFVADTTLQWDLDYHRLIISPGDQNFCAFLPLYGESGYRVIGTLPKNYFNKENIAFQDIKDVVVKTIGIPLRFESVNWFSTYKLHHRGVDHFREGSVFLAGDSAHIHSPAGGQGMNTGLQDAYNLCWKLALVLRGQAGPGLLDTYNEERLPFAKWLLNFTDRAFNFMTSNNWLIKFVRKLVVLNTAGQALASLPIRPFIFKVLSQIWYSYNGGTISRSISHQKLRINAGDRVPFFPTNNIHLLLKGASFHLLHLNDQSIQREHLTKIESIFPFPVKVIEMPITGEWEKLGVKKELYLLVRPDNYIAFIFDYFDEVSIKSYLKKYFQR